MSIIKESLVLSLLWFSSVSQAATELNPSFSVKAPETGESVSLSPLQAFAVNQTLAVVANERLNESLTSSQPEVSNFSAEAAAFGEKLMQPISFFSVSNPIKPYPSNSFSTIRAADTPSISTDKQYEFWSMVLVGFLLVLGQIAGVKNTGSDLKLAPFKS